MNRRVDIEFFNGIFVFWFVVFHHTKKHYPNALPTYHSVYYLILYFLIKLKFFSINFNTNIYIYIASLECQMRHLKIWRIDYYAVLKCLKIIDIETIFRLFCFCLSGLEQLPFFKTFYEQVRVPTYYTHRRATLLRPNVIRPTLNICY